MEIGEQELKKTLAGFHDLDDKERRRLEAMVNAIGNKFLHHPINYLKSKDGNSESLPATTIRKIFHLTENESE